jgi:hypothetical protein
MAPIFELFSGVAKIQAFVTPLPGGDFNKERELSALNPNVNAALMDGGLTFVRYNKDWVESLDCSIAITL